MQIPAMPTGNNPNIPAGFTYLGQFVDHDITLDLTSLGDKEKDPLGIENFRTPSFDLDSVYGLGPDGSPHLYARNPAAGNKHGPKMLIGKNIISTRRRKGRLPQRPAAQPGGLRTDRRSPQRRKSARRADTSGVFEIPQRGLRYARQRAPIRRPISSRKRGSIVTWHYQWMVLHDWVERLTEPGIVAKILHDGRKFYRFKKVPYIPVEFSAAAYRLGHSMVRQRVCAQQSLHRRLISVCFFAFSGLSGGIIGDLAPNPPTRRPTRLSEAAEQLDHRLAALL